MIPTQILFRAHPCHSQTLFLSAHTLLGASILWRLKASRTRIDMKGMASSEVTESHSEETERQAVVGPPAVGRSGVAMQRIPLRSPI